MTAILESGIAVFHIISGQLQKKGRIEVLLDDGYWPCLSTMKARSAHAQWGYVGEGFIKEIDFGRVWLRLCESDDADKGEVLAEWKGDAKPFLEHTMVRWNLALFSSFLNPFCREERGLMSCRIGTTKLLPQFWLKPDMCLFLSY